MDYGSIAGLLKSMPALPLEFLNGRWAAWVFASRTKKAGDYLQSWVLESNFVPSLQTGGTIMPPLSKQDQPIRKAPFVTISMFMLMGMAGIWLNEPGRVLEQAWQVCLSCIGIG